MDIFNKLKLKEYSMIASIIFDYFYNDRIVFLIDDLHSIYSKILEFLKQIVVFINYLIIDDHDAWYEIICKLWFNLFLMLCFINLVFNVGIKDQLWLLLYPFEKLAPLAVFFSKKLLLVLPAYQKNRSKIHDFIMVIFKNLEILSIFVGSMICIFNIQMKNLIYYINKLNIHVFDKIIYFTNFYLFKLLHTWLYNHGFISKILFIKIKI